MKEHILGYSAYWNKNQTIYLNNSYKIKSEIVELAQQKNDYGTGLETLLVFYNFETEPNEFAGTDLLEKKIALRAYSTKEQSIRVNVYVGFNELETKTEVEQIEFYFQTTIKAIDLVHEKFSKRKSKEVNIDFKMLKEDIIQGFISQYPNLAQSAT